MRIPLWLFKVEQAPIKKKMKKVYNPKTSKQIARENMKVDDKEVQKEKAETMPNPYFFIDENIKMGFKINLESHNLNHTNSFLNVFPNSPDIGIETSYNKKILKVMAIFYARVKNQCKFQCHIFFSASFYKNKQEDQRTDESKIFNNLTINNNLTDSDIDNIDVTSQLEHQTRIQETKEYGWIFDKINSMEISFYKLEN